MVERIYFRRETLLGKIFGFGRERFFDRKGNTFEGYKLIYRGSFPIPKGEKPEDIAEREGGKNACYKVRRGEIEVYNKFVT